jgi:PAS domain S-box-containing protein
MPEGVLIIDSGGRIQYWNAAMEKLTGHAAQDAIGASTAILNCDETKSTEVPDGNTTREEQWLKHDAERSVFREECTLYTRTGENIPVLKSARILRDNEGNAAVLLETVTDLRHRDDPSPIKPVTAKKKTAHCGPGQLVGASHAMQEIYDRIRLAAQSDATVLIHGDTGTGKELVADAIHRLSARRHASFIKVNCSALPENLLESELFGHIKGAFTGATTNKIGRFEAAEGGTLLLDEIGDISPLIQLKLLRVIQERTFERVGEARPRKADVRVIAATHRNLREGVEKGTIREDFYYRIKVFDIRTPSLVERTEDIPLLADAFIARFNQRTGKQIHGLSGEVIRVFMDYCWPGNVRELENAIEHAFVTCTDDTINMQDLPLELQTAQIRLAECRRKGLPPTLAFTPSRYAPNSREELIAILESCGWNKTEAARRLGIERSTVWRRMKRWNIPLSGFPPAADRS